ncbi:DNA polymerase I [Microcoleus sp. FACHB-SPT15]|uniref:DNA polymerase I n=1 Tax=Microcoleus sp. FACHB-SPT15 TaxID=2692830 RepID=UPI001784707B|nr:DNA polymerase I [Microcoleus sp. FACHB-SPT15]MBD1807348.1 DNA polymerase I [Microcoleus sp. FACHB-SPT15]
MSQSTPASNPPVSAASSSEQPLFILVDGHSLAFRSYFAFAKGRDGGLRTTTGIPTSVCFGFIKSLVEVMGSEQPQAMAVAFDLGLPTFRHEADDTYKADRPGTPEDFVPDLKNLQKLLEAFNLPVVTSPGYEADDVLATLARQASETGYRVKILTGDRDLFQLVDPKKGISVLYLSTDFLKQRGRSTGPAEFGPEQVEEKLGILPEQVVDYKALCGDKSDNIPGVRGIGEKTAVTLLKEYGTLEAIYASLDKIKGAVKTRLETGKQEAEHSKYLAQLAFDAPVDMKLEDGNLEGFDTEVLKPLLEELELKSFLGRIDQLQQTFGGRASRDSQTPEKAQDVAPSQAESVEEELTFPSPDSNDPALWFFSAADTEAAQQQASHQAALQPSTIDTLEKLTELVAQLQQCTDPATPVAWDTETSDLEPRDAELVGIGCCFATLKNPPQPPLAKGGSNSELQRSDVEVAYIPVGHKDGNNLDKNTVLEALRPILESADYPKALQNAKFDRLVLRCQGIKLAGVVFDTMLASYVINPANSPANSNNLSALAMKYLGIMAKSYTDLVPKGKTIADLDIQSVADYCGMDVYTTFGLVSKLREELEKAPALHKLLLEVEQPLEPVLAQMEYTGIRVNVAYLGELEQQLGKDLQAIEQNAYDAVPNSIFRDYLQKIWQQKEPDLAAILKQKDYKNVPSSILKGYLQKLSQQKELDLAAIKHKVYDAVPSEILNFNSPEQVSELLFDILKLDRKKSRKTPSKGYYSTAVDVLEKLQGDHPIIDYLLEYRTLHKLNSTYVEAIPKLVRSDTQRVHTDFNQTITDTGRLSSSNPNLQNIPIGTAFSRQIRKAFIPESGWVLVGADYSQIELRILAHLTQEPILVETYQKNEDIHAVTARLLFEKEIVTPDERRLGKTINFGVIYGMGAQRFARETGISAALGKTFIERFNQRYPKVFAYLQQLQREAIAQGYVETILGRRRYFNFTSHDLLRYRGNNPTDINLDQFKGLGPNDAGLLRAAANAPIQGSSADIIKITMVKMHELLQNYQARLLLQVHDELIFEVPPDEWEELQPKIKSTMESAVKLSVPLVADVHAGQNWMETK